MVRVSRTTFYFYNKRLPAIYKELQKRYLPGGYNLDELLKHYTIKSFYYDYQGFVTSPTHSMAYEFIDCARKYL
jgi:hypothetical protein